MVFPEWWGAVGDGATDDIAAFDAVATFINTLGGGQIRLRQETTYALSTAWDISTDYIEVVGAGRGTVLLFTGATDGITATLTSSNRGPSIKNLGVKTSNAGGGSGIYLESCNGVLLERLWITDTGSGAWEYGIEAEFTLISTARDVELNGVGTKAAIRLWSNATNENSNAWDIENVQIEGSYHIGILIESVSGFSIVGGVIEGTATVAGVVVRRQRNSNHYANGIITGVHFEDVSGDADNIDIDGAVRGVSIIGNYLSTTGTYGIRVGNVDAISGSTHDGGNDSADLIDTTTNFVTSGVRIGDLINNTTDGSDGRVTAISTTTNPNDTLSMVLEGGTDDDWDTGDSWSTGSNETENITIEGNQFVGGGLLVNALANHTTIRNNFFTASLTVTDNSLTKTTTVLENRFASAVEVRTQGWRDISNGIQSTGGFWQPSWQDDTDLLLDLPMDEGSGSIVYDRSGNGNYGIITSATWSTSDYGAALLFDGANDFVHIPDDAAIRLGAGDWTIEAYVYMASGRGNIGTLMGQWTDAGKFYITIDTGGGVKFYASPTASSMHANWDALADDTWHHLVFQRSGDDLLYYQDGVLVVTDTNYLSGENFNTTEGLWIGSVYDQRTAKMFEGRIAGVRMYSRVLSGAEVAAHASRNIRPQAARHGNFRVWGDTTVDGLTVQDRDTLGSELVTNGSFTSDAASWTANNSTLASVVGGESGNALEITNTGAAKGEARQLITVKTGRTYKIVFWHNGDATTTNPIRGRATFDSAAYELATGDLLTVVVDNQQLHQFIYFVTAITDSIYINLIVDSAQSAKTTLFDTVSIKEVAGGDVVVNNALTVKSANIGDGGVTDYLEVVSDGFVTLKGAARASIDHEFEPSNLKLPASNFPGTATIGLTPVFQFNAASDEEVFGAFEIEHAYSNGTDLRAHFHWAPTDGNAGNVTWGIEWHATTPNNNQVLTEATTTQIVVDATESLQDEVLLTGDITISGAGITSEMTFHFRIFRDADASEGGASDNYGADASLVHFDIEIMTDGFGKDEQW